MEMRIKAKDFWKSVPIQYVADGFIVSKTGDLTIGWEIELPAVFSNDSRSLLEIPEALGKAISFLPPWIMVHRQDVYYRRRYRPQSKESFLGACYERHYAGRSFLSHRQFIYLTMTSKQSALRPHSSSGLFYNNFLSGKVAREKATRLLSIGNDFMSSFTSSGMIRAKRLDEEALMENLTLYRRFGMYTSQDADIELHPDRIISGEDILWTYSYSEAADLPGYMKQTVKAEKYSSQHSVLHTSAGAAVGPLLSREHIVNSYILTLPKDETLSEMDSRRRRMQSMSSRDAENRLNAEELEKYLAAVHKDSLVTVRYHFNIMVWGDDRHRDAISGDVTSALARMNVSSVLNTYDTPVIWYAGFPGAACELSKDNLMTMELSGSLCTGISETFQRGIPGGIVKLRDRIRGIPVTIDMQEAAERAGYVSNYNAFIMGPSGSGKSFFTNTLMRNCYDAGETVFIIDIGDSYEGLCSVINDQTGGKDGHYYRWDTISRLSFDAFWDIRTWMSESGVLNKQSEGLGFVTSFIQTLWKPREGWTSSNSNILDSMLGDFARSRSQMQENAILDDLLAFLRGDIMKKMRSSDGYRCGESSVSLKSFDLKDMLTALESYSSKGPYGFLLNDRNPADIISSRFTVFEMQQITESKDQFLSLVLLCIMNAFNAKMRREPEKFKVLVIEEAWKAIMNETMSPFMKSLWKTSRKFNTSAIVVTQQMSDIVGSEYIKDTILENSDTKILLKPTGNQSVLDEMCDLLGLTPHQRSLVMSMNMRQSKARDVFISLSDQFCGVFTNEVSPQEAIAYESNKGRKKEFLELSQTLGHIGAICRLTGGEP